MWMSGFANGSGTWRVFVRGGVMKVKYTLIGGPLHGRGVEAEPCEWLQYEASICNEMNRLCGATIVSGLEFALSRG